MFAHFVFFDIPQWTIVIYSIKWMYHNNDNSCKSEREVLNYIAEELGVSQDVLIVPEFKCCTCFNILRDQFFRNGYSCFLSVERQVEKLGLLMNDHGTLYDFI